MTGARAATPRIFEAREAQLASLDALPRGLWLGSLVNSQGVLVPRLGALAQLREALLAGECPDWRSSGWPGAVLAGELGECLRELGLPAICRGRAAVADLVVGSLLWHLDRIVDYMDQGEDAATAARHALQAFADDWRERRGMLEEIEAVLGDMDELLKNTHWDALRGLLRSEGWQEIVRIRGLMARLPELERLIRRLGRAAPGRETVAQAATDFHALEKATAPRADRRTTRVPELPGETRGVYRSGRISRMLPSETLLFSHPRLRLVWHARHAERSLLSYEEDDRLQEADRARRPVWRPSPRPRPAPRMESGPMLLCVDTSGSMQGGAEAVAKAVVLEAVRTAHRQGRACRLYAFGGPEEVLEIELRLDGPGISQLAEFIGQGFRGGTDICGPLERVVARLAEERWRLADLLIASDGEFGATPDTAAAVARAKAELGLRVQGILIGDRETLGLLEVADDIFWVRDWRRYGTSEADSPVHSRSLTALYFPNALRSPRPAA